MEIVSHQINGKNIAEVSSEGVLIGSAGDGLDLLGNLYYQGFDCAIIAEEAIAPEFFDLKNGMAGEILQKFSNYRFPLAIVGDFEKYTAKSIHDFIYESNKMGQVNFVPTVAMALSKLSGS